MQKPFPKVAVVMSTYNGEKFLSEQIDSILAQEDVEVDLFIRDDGSHDSTLAIIREYCKKNASVSFLEDGLSNLGPGESFMLLLSGVFDGSRGVYEFYAFADQDDVWLSNKLSAAIEYLGEGHDPSLYCSNQYLYTLQNGVSSIRNMKFSTTPDLSLFGHLTKNELSGCTMVMNRELVSLIAGVELPSKSILDYRMHDAWVFLVAASLGRVAYDNRSFILYRIHSDNTVGVRQLRLSERVRRVLRPDKGKEPYRNLRMRTAQNLICRYPTLENEECVAAFAHYKCSMIAKMGLIRLFKNGHSSGESSFAFALKVLIGFV